MPDYSQGKIYKIVSSKTNKIYIGSTAVKYLSQRMVEHRSHYKQWNKGTRPYTTSYEVVKYPDAKIILIENWRCSSKDSLFAREQEWIDYEKNSCNKNNSKPPNRCDWCNYEPEYSPSDMHRHNRTHKHKANKKYWNEFIDSLK